MVSADDFRIISNAFENGRMIPAEYTGAGADISPELEWFNPPEGTESYVLIVEDPDAPGRTWVHWLLYNIPKDVSSLDENIPKVAILPEGAMQGINDFGELGYGGPMPPPGPPHRYFFKLYALDAYLGLSPELKKPELEEAIKDHILAEAVLLGIFER